MSEILLLKNFLIAFALGILIGLEREYAQFKGKYVSFAGIRTFPLISLSGALFAYLSKLISVWILLVGTIIFSGLIIAAYYSSSIKAKYHGITTAMAAFIAFFTGILCLYDKINLAIIIALITTVLLYARTFLHHFAQKIQQKEMVDTLKFIAIAFVILPFLPNQWYGPYGLFNPFLTWLMVVFVSGISFAGYILIKWFGEQGIEITGLFGGLVSSTIITTNFAERSKKNNKIAYALALGTILAIAVAFVRTLVIIFVINQTLFMKIIIPVLVLTIIALIISYFLFRKKEMVQHGPLELSSPFTLWPALRFGLLFAGIMALIKLSNTYFASQGIYLISFLSGLANADTIIISLSQLAKKEITESIAEKGIVIAILTSIAFRGGLAYYFGSKQFGKIILVSTILLLTTGIIVLALI